MQHVVSACVGTTANGRSRYSGCNCCSTDAKKLFRSMWRKPKRSDSSPQRASWSGPDWMLSDMAVVGCSGYPLPPYHHGNSQEINHLALDLVHFFCPKPPTPGEQRPLAGNPESCRKPHPLTRPSVYLAAELIIPAVSRMGLWISSLFVCRAMEKRFADTATTLVPFATR